MRTPLIELVPPEVLAAVADRTAVEVGFGAGPSWVYRKDHRYAPPVALAVALAWLEPHRDTFKKGHVRLDDGAVLYFYPDAFIRHAPAPRPP